MLFRNCAGGVVFYANKVLIIKNEKNEWVLPKGVIRNGNLANDVALERVEEETGVKASILTSAGETSYEFFSFTRQQPVCNQINWYVMKADSAELDFKPTDNILEAGFYPVDQAIDMITYSQDKSLVSLSYKKFKEISLEGKG